MKPKITIIAQAIVLLCASIALIGSCSHTPARQAFMKSNQIQGIRFDPSYYYNINKTPAALADSLCSLWEAYGINTVFFKAYDPEYGAVYKTSYSCNRQTDYGRQDLMGHFLQSAHTRHIRFMVWLSPFEHKGAWDAHSDWRIKSENGSDLMPFPHRNFLCVRHPDMRTWWQGFLQDIITHYPDIDGIDLAEPAVVWKNNLTCACDLCKRDLGAGSAAQSPASVEKRSAKLTELLVGSCSMIQKTGKICCCTVIPTVDQHGDLVPFSMQKRISGLDIEDLLNGATRPDWVSFELMWQQWADAYDDPATFRPAWTQRAVEQALAALKGRAHFIAHVEMTPLGPVLVSPQELSASIVAARIGGARSIELYDSHLVDSLKAWKGIPEAWKTHSDRSVFVLYDPEGTGLARQIATLFGHFDVRTIVEPVDSFAENRLRPNDCVAYVGSKAGRRLPQEFISFARSMKTHLLWMNYNLSEVVRADSLYSFHVKETRYGHDYTRVLYKNKSLFKNDSVMNIIVVDDTGKVKVHAWAISKNGTRVPYIVQSRNFWYIADCPVDYMAEGCRHIVLADLLHPFLEEDHLTQHTALVRIEDVCAFSDPAAIRRIADVLWSEKIPFSISLVPFYVDPEENAAISLSDKPALVDAVTYAVSRGASIVMHGSTHQYRGRSTSDYEFWDGVNNRPLFEDNDEYVRVRIQRGIDEFRKNGLNPLVFETPHYAASQRDYAIIDRFFSAEYGRRQVIDKKGFDQLVPYMIWRHPSGTTIIPENLGYIPTENQDASPIITSADNNLAVRDGFASFFFHPWINISVLKGIIKGLRGLGYQFSDIRSVPMKVSSQDFVQVTGSQGISLEIKNKYVHTFFVDNRGKKHQEWYSDEPVSRTFAKQVSCPPEWAFVAEAVGRRPSLFSSVSLSNAKFISGVRKWLFAAPPITLLKGKPARVCVLCADSAGRPGTGAIAQNAWRQAFWDCGIDLSPVRVETFFGLQDSFNLVVVPEISAGRLSSQQVLALSHAVAAGANIILEGPSPLAENIGIHARDTARLVRDVYDEYFPDVPVHWKRPSPYHPFSADVEYVNQYTSADSLPVVVGGEYGEGMYLFFACGFTEDNVPASYRYPFFLDMIERQFDLHPVTRTSNLEVYFDPGNRENAHMEDVVLMWKLNGVHIVHIAAWHEYADYTYEYNELIALLHRHGMKGYAWLELPHISEKFWTAHPQWQEITAAGRTAKIGWRYCMNLTNDTCRAGAFNALKRILMLADWDGVNLSGTLFSGDSPDSLQSITPMHPSFRASYKQARGYDPQLIFSPHSPYWYKKDLRYWKEFRYFRDSTELNITWQCLDFLNRQNMFAHSVFPIVLTRPYSDTSIAPFESSYFHLANSGPLTKLQIQPPLRSIDASALSELVEKVKKRYPEWKPMVQLNLDDISARSGGTRELCGAELMGVIAAAIKNGIRVSLRTEENLFDVDFKTIGFASAAPSIERFSDENWTIESAIPEFADINGNKIPSILCDDAPWPAYNKGHVLLPVGSHSLTSSSRFNTWKSFLLSPCKILFFDGSILSAESTIRGLQFSYTSEDYASLVLSQKPHVLFVDGLPFSKAGGNDTAIVLPPGRHAVKVNVNGLPSMLLREASLGLSGVIITVSSFAIGIFLLLYLRGIVYRKIKRKTMKTKNTAAS